jgi:hypothetical protein
MFAHLKRAGVGTNGVLEGNFLPKRALCLHSAINIKKVKVRWRADVAGAAGAWSDSILEYTMQEYKVQSTPS